MSAELPFRPDEIEYFTEGLFACARVAPGRAPCALCQGTGLRLIERDGVEVAGRCRCQMLPDRVELFNNARLPARHVDSSFSSFDATLAGAQMGYQGVQIWVKDYLAGKSPRGLVLYGEVGRGKTHLLVSVLRRLIFMRGVHCRFVEFSQLLADLKEGFDQGKAEGALLGPLSEVEVLAIDELGKGRRTDWELSIIDDLISRRYNSMKVTLATTNYDYKVPKKGKEGARAEPGNLSTVRGETLEDRVGERVYSRLREMCQFVPIAGEDYRLLAGRGVAG